MNSKLQIDDFMPLFFCPSLDSLFSILFLKLNELTAFLACPKLVNREKLNLLDQNKFSTLLINCCYYEKVAMHF
ncbi:hypothetical protein JYB64_11850 [Algoriphagus aestuarii]|nr:hypothetical protein [Algoriphagus aestuarii]